MRYSNKTKELQYSFAERFSERRSFVVRVSTLEFVKQGAVGFVMGLLDSLFPKDTEKAARKQFQKEEADD